jgi:hypothetical protein
MPTECGACQLCVVCQLQWTSALTRALPPLRWGAEDGRATAFIATAGTCVSAVSTAFCSQCSAAFASAVGSTDVVAECCGATSTTALHRNRRICCPRTVHVRAIRRGILCQRVVGRQSIPSVSACTVTTRQWRRHTRDLRLVPHRLRFEARQQPAAIAALREHSAQSKVSSPSSQRR